MSGKGRRMFLVVGATGNVGSEVVGALARDGQQVRALVRDPAKALLPDGVEVVTGDLDAPADLAPALRGVHGVFLLPGYKDMPGLLAEVREAGVERVVLLSGGSAGTGDLTNAVSAYMIRSEAAVKESGLPWTFIRPSAFMANALRWLPQLRVGDTVEVPFATLRTAVIDPYDIGTVAAAALTGDGHAGVIYRPTGPEALLPEEQLAILGREIGRELRCVPLSNDDAYTRMSGEMPQMYVDAFFDFYVKGTLDESIVRPTVKEVTGHEPRTFEQWAAAHASAFA